MSSVPSLSTSRKKRNISHSSEPRSKRKNLGNLDKVLNGGPPPLIDVVDISDDDGDDQRPNDLFNDDFQSPVSKNSKRNISNDSPVQFSDSDSDHESVSSSKRLKKKKRKSPAPKSKNIKIIQNPSHSNTDSSDSDEETNEKTNVSSSAPQIESLTLDRSKYQHTEKQLKRIQRRIDNKKLKLLADNPTIGDQAKYLNEKIIDCIGQEIGPKIASVLVPDSFGYFPHGGRSSAFSKLLKSSSPQWMISYTGFSTAKNGNLLSIDLVQNLPKFKRSALAKFGIGKGCPVIIFCSLSTSRCLEIYRKMKAMTPTGQKYRPPVGKFWAKHMDIADQVIQLKHMKFRCIVATPKRMLRLLESKALRLKNCKYLFFDCVPTKTGQDIFTGHEEVPDVVEIVVKYVVPEMEKAEKHLKLVLFK